MNLTWRISTPADLDLLGEWNRQLICDEGHRNPMTVDQLVERMEGWLSIEYTAVIFSDDAAPVAYALYRSDADSIYLRHFFVRRERRRMGFGREAFGILRSQIWPSGMRLTLEVLTANAAGMAFWRSVGFKDYCLTLEILPPE
ncbi:MAG: GNAT family N-acetyltransferase [Opitutaceae bacterium]|jgi:GNAT superfamily N-acetyltransferase